MGRNSGRRDREIQTAQLTPPSTLGINFKNIEDEYERNSKKFSLVKVPPGGAKKIEILLLMLIPFCRPNGRWYVIHMSLAFVRMHYGFNFTNFEICNMQVLI